MNEIIEWDDPEIDDPNPDNVAVIQCAYKPRYRFVWDNCDGFINADGEVRTLERGHDPGPGWYLLTPKEIK